MIHQNGHAGKTCNAGKFDVHRIVDWVQSDRPDSELVIRVLEHAWLWRGQPHGVLFHSDQGSQYGALRFRQWWWRYRMQQSMT